METAYAGLMKTASEFKKGDRVYWTRFGLLTTMNDSLVVVTNVYHIEITSMGKKQGTAVLVADESRMKIQIYPNYVFYETLEEVQKIHEEGYLDVGERHRSGLIDLWETWKINYGPASRAKFGDLHWNNIQSRLDLIKSESVTEKFIVL